jgi:Fe-S-cluster containining protein
MGIGIEYSPSRVTKQAAQIPRGPREELQQIYREADALMTHGTCACTDAHSPSDAMCCHFGRIGREPYVTPLEMVEVARAVAARGGLPRRRLPLLDELRTCPLLSQAGRCMIYEARPLGCRTFFCEGHEPPGGTRARKALLALSRRVADLSLRAFPRGEGPRTLTRALAASPRAPSSR